jgi:hypothetical protein
LSKSGISPNIPLNQPGDLKHQTSGQFKMQNKNQIINKDFGFANTTVHSGQYIDTSIIDQQLYNIPDAMHKNFSGSPLSKGSRKMSESPSRVSAGGKGKIILLLPQLHANKIDEFSTKINNSNLNQEPEEQPSMGSQNLNSATFPTRRMSPRIQDHSGGKLDELQA